MIFNYFKKNNYQTVKTYSLKNSKVFPSKKKKTPFKILTRLFINFFVINLHIDQCNKKVYTEYFIKIYF